jgi:hypothetical protein
MRMIDIFYHMLTGSVMVYGIFVIFRLNKSKLPMNRSRLFSLNKSFRILKKLNTRWEYSEKHNSREVNLFPIRMPGMFRLRESLAKGLWAWLRARNGRKASGSLSRCSGAVTLRF